MPALHPNLRKKLEKTVVKARDIAEKASEDALRALAVDHHETFEHMTPEQRDLRRRLRAHGRAIGDTLDPNRMQALYHLITETAYQHWHRMLFARFLAENNLLMHPSDVPVTLEECEELAAEEGIDKWELVTGYAAKMLPAIFRPDDPVLQIEFAPENKLELERLLADLEQEVFKADDSLGWVYQFWQTKKKDEVNRSEKKIGADELPAVTQLFTEDYMVKFLLHNSLGAWWAGKFLAKNLDVATNKELTEDDLRNVVAIDDYSFDFLRFIFDDEKGSWQPTGSCFEGWPSEAKDITILDPCCGSGHFLVAAFELMVHIRVAEEDLSTEEAVGAVLKDNIFGLEIDARCTQIAAFALALSAWTSPDAKGYRRLPELNIACSGIPVAAKKEDWLKLASGNEKLKNGMDRLWIMFRQAPVLGSLIDPNVGDKHELIEASFGDLQPLLEKALGSEKTKVDFDLNEAAVAARGIAQSAEILAKKYTLVTTNVPYLGRKKHNKVLKNYCETHHPDARLDLATCFIERCLSICAQFGCTTLVIPQNTLFLGSYRYLRENLLRTITWNSVGRLGPRGFQTPMFDFGVALIGFTRVAPTKQNAFSAIDVSFAPTPDEKSTALQSIVFSSFGQESQLTNPNSAIIFSEMPEITLLSNYADSYQGAHTYDINRFRLNFWESNNFEKQWNLHSSSPNGIKLFSGNSFISFKRDEDNEFGKIIREIADDPNETRSIMWRAGHQAWGKRGVACSWMGKLPTALYLGTIYDNSIAVIVPHDDRHLLPIWCFCSSPEFSKEVRKINQKTQVAHATLVKVPFDLAHWQTVATEKYPHRLPEAFSSDPTQWLFNGHPQGSDQPLHVSVALLLGYRWPRQTGSHLPDCPALGPNGLEKHADDDGIVCIPAVRGEQSAADRLRAILAAAFGQEWSPTKEAELLSAVEARRGLEDWLRNKFFAQHCKLFHNRPFIWHIWDGEKDGFAALVNYHKLDSKLLETLTYSYLGDWINKQKADFEAGVAGAERRMLAAQVLQKKLQLILKGEKPFDIFVRWKSIEEQPMGCEPDLNDGVRLNIRPFFRADVLRKKPNIKWTKDRGKEPTRPKEQFPWFWDGDEFKGDRVNDVHLSLKVKQEARERAAKEAKVR